MNNRMPRAGFGRMTYADSENQVETLFSTFGTGVELIGTRASNTALSSANDGNLFSGSFSMHRRMTFSRSAGIEGSNSLGRTGVSVVCFIAMAIGVSPVNATRAVKSSYM